MKANQKVKTRYDLLCRVIRSISRPPSCHSNPSALALRNLWASMVDYCIVLWLWDMCRYLLINPSSVTYTEFYPCFEIKNVQPFVIYRQITEIYVNGMNKVSDIKCATCFMVFGAHLAQVLLLLTCYKFKFPVLKQFVGIVLVPIFRVILVIVMF